MVNMSDKADGEAAPPNETAELESNISDIIGEVISEESEAPVEQSAEADVPSEPVLSQDENATPETGDAKEESGDGDLSPDIQRAIDKRIAKAVAKQKAAEEASSEAQSTIDELQSQLDDARNQPGLKTDKPSKGPIQKAKNLNELDSEAQRAEQVLDWSDDMLMQLKSEPEKVADELKKQKVELHDEYGEEDYSSEKMDVFLSKLRRNADRTLRREVPERRDYLEQKEQSESRLKDIFPHYEDENSQFYKDAVDVMNTLPEIERLPHHKTAAGVFALGLEQLRQIESEQKANRNRSSSLPPQQPGAPAAAPAVEPNAVGDGGNSALKSWSETGDEGEFDKFIETLV